MRCVIVVPSHRVPEPDVLDCLRSLTGSGVPILHARNISLICRGRSQLVSRFLREEYDRMLFWDDDILCEPSQALDLLHGDLPEPACIAGGVYPVKAQPRICAHGHAFPLTLGQRGFVRTDFVGAGFMLITREAAGKVAEGLTACVDDEENGPFHPFFAPIIDEPSKRAGFNQYLGEDYSFCLRARRAGVGVYLATGPLLQHVGSYGWTVEDALQSVGGRMRPGHRTLTLEAEPDASPKD